MRRPETTNTPPPVPSDEATRAYGAPGALPLRPIAPRDAFLIAHDRMTVLAGLAAGPAALIAVVTPQGRVLEAARVEAGRALILGRHSRCGLRIDAPAVALRQLALLVREDAGRATAHLWDLDTGTPFAAEDGAPNAAVASDGPLYVAVHGYAIWIVPAALAAGWPPSARDAWDALPPRVFVDRRAPLAPSPARKPAPATTRPPPPPRPLDDEHTHVTFHGPPMLLGDDDGPEVAWGVLRVEDGPRHVAHPISAERLDRGVLVGRYDRCSLAARGPGHEVSRVHALVVKIGADVWIVDTASTHGTFRGPQVVEADVLRDADALSLAGVAILRWRRYAHPQA